MSNSGRIAAEVVEAVPLLQGRKRAHAPGVQAADAVVPAAGSSGVIGAADAVAGTVGTVASVGMMGGMGALFAAGFSNKVLGGIARLAKSDRWQKRLAAPSEALHAPVENPRFGLAPGNNRFGIAMDVAGSLMSGSQLYGVARSFSDKLDSLKQIYADMTGKNVSQVSTLSVLTGNVPKTVREARTHVLLEHGSRGFFSAAWGAISLRGLFKGSGIGMKTGLFLGLANEGIDRVMGEAPVLHIYKGVSDAYKSGKTLSAQDYAMFTLAASDALRSHGKVGEAFAIELGKQYAAENAKPWEILKEIEKGILNQRIEKIKAAHPIAAHAKPAHAEARLQRKTDPNARAVVGDGKFTGQLHQEALQQHMTPGRA
ncbi:MAG: hypothetical protein KGJ06_05505 [Pseudomonadota bacterium]|nr:hypothetical protein [Pseudomonadota bacterium]